MKTVYIKTYGCQMNVYDSARIADIFMSLGYKVSNTAASADVLVFNGCSIRAKAFEKVFSDIGRVKSVLKRKGKQAITILAGCVGQAAGKAAFRRGVDIVVGPRSYQKLPELLAEFESKQKPCLELMIANNEKFESLPDKLQAAGPSAFLTIQEGCNKFCRYCSVPYTRGREFSRPFDQILKEAQQLADLGACEIILLGQNVNAYACDECDLASLIEQIARIKGLKRLRYMTSHPLDMSPSLIKAHAAIEQLMPQIHLPVQSGSDKILKAMNRRHTAEKYFQIVADLKKARPDLCLSTDIIVGYPGETDEDFTATLNLLEQVKFAQVYSFKYSPRKGTPAAELPQIPEKIKEERLEILQKLVDGHQKSFNESFLGKHLEALLTKPGKQKGQAVGFSQYMQPVVVENAAALIGKIINMRIEKILVHTLAGSVCRTLPQSS